SAPNSSLPASAPPPISPLPLARGGEPTHPPHPRAPLGLRLAPAMEDDEYEEGMEMDMGGHQHLQHRGYGAEEEVEGGYAGGGDGEDEEEEARDEEEITQEDAWAVISAYFEEKGLVRQQLDSFDEFIQNTMQEIVDESADIEIRPESQHNPGRQAEFAEVALPTIPNMA
uniref:DNA-directed RNA polymerase n=1 Tax=Aegilops tauschii subsp. strangulata TaxID=200361 RepID=A0A453LPV9_AEGTS